MEQRRLSEDTSVAIRMRSRSGQIHARHRSDRHSLGRTTSDTTPDEVNLTVGEIRDLSNNPTV